MLWFPVLMSSHDDLTAPFRIKPSSQDFGDSDDMHIIGASKRGEGQMFILMLACGVSIVVIGLLFLMAAGLDMPLPRQVDSYGQADLKVCTVIDLDERRPRISHTSIKIPGLE